jgi:hypothetical protein
MLEQYKYRNARNPESRNKKKLGILPLGSDLRDTWGRIGGIHARFAADDRRNPVPLSASTLFLALLENPGTKPAGHTAAASAGGQR